MFFLLTRFFFCPNSQNQGICDCFVKCVIAVLDGECSNHCGRGTRTITKECVQEIIGYREPYPIHNSSCLHLPNPPPDIEQCEGPCNSVFWKYGEWSPVSNRGRNVFVLTKSGTKFL